MKVESVKKRCASYAWAKNRIRNVSYAVRNFASRRYKKRGYIAQIHAKGK